MRTGAVDCRFAEDAGHGKIVAAGRGRDLGRVHVHWLRRPLILVVPLPLDGLGNVVGTEGPTEKRTVTPDTGLPKRSVTVAVTQWFAPTVFVASGGVKMSFAGAPATHSLVAWAQCSTPRSSVKQASMLSVPVRPLLV